MCRAIGSASSSGSGPRAIFSARVSPVYQLHHQRAHTPGLFNTMDVRDVWVVEGGKDSCLPVESREALRVFREEIREDLDSDVAIQARVTGTIDLAHPAGAKQAENLVRTESRAHAEGQERCSSCAEVYADRQQEGLVAVADAGRPHEGRQMRKKQRAGSRRPPCRPAKPDTTTDCRLSTRTDDSDCRLRLPTHDRRLPTVTRTRDVVPQFEHL